MQYCRTQITVLLLKMICVEDAHKITEIQTTTSDFLNCRPVLLKKI